MTSSIQKKIQKKDQYLKLKEKFIFENKYIMYYKQLRLFWRLVNMFLIS